MGKVISTLLFQPPDKPTSMKNKKYFWLKTGLGVNIPAFFIRQKNAKFTVLYSHGNAEDLGMIYDYLKELSDILYINIFAYDYSGYGLGATEQENMEKEVKPSEENCYADIEAAYEYLKDEENITNSHLVLYGRSVGSGPSCYLAQKLANKGDSAAGLILHSPFLSVCRVVVDTGFENPYDLFPNVTRIRDIRCPTFIIHGTKDEIVPFNHGSDLYEDLPKQYQYPPFWAENMGHNNIEVEMTSVFIKKLQKYFIHILQNSLDSSADSVSSKSVSSSSRRRRSNHYYQEDDEFDEKSSKSETAHSTLEMMHRLTRTSSRSLPKSKTRIPQKEMTTDTVGSSSRSRSSSRRKYYNQHSSRSRDKRSASPNQTISRRNSSESREDTVNDTDGEFLHMVTQEVSEVTFDVDAYLLDDEVLK